MVLIFHGRKKEWVIHDMIWRRILGRYLGGEFHLKMLEGRGIWSMRNGLIEDLLLLEDIHKH